MKTLFLSLLFVMGAAGVVLADQGVATHQTSSKPAQFHAMSQMQAPRAMSDKQLAAIEGAGKHMGAENAGVTWPYYMTGSGKLKPVSKSK